MANILRNGRRPVYFASHDIGDFEASSELSMRVTCRNYVFACRVNHDGIYSLASTCTVSSHSQLHDSHSCRVPRHFGEEASQVLATFHAAELWLVPYLSGPVIEADTTSSTQEAILVDFLEDRRHCP